MKTLTKKILPYLITSLLVIGFWKMWTWTDNYAWFPKGKELLALEIALTSIFFYKTFFWLVTANLFVFGILQLRKRNFKTAGIAIALTLAYHFAVGHVIDKKCAFQYYSVFHNQSVAEGYIVDPIKEAGYEIGPILTEKIKDKEMKYRVYAMLGLQNLNYEPATETMKQILFDSSENVIYRANAYEFLLTVKTNDSKKIIEEYRTNATDSINKEVVRLGEYFYESE
jgi:hypothetical protein